MNKMYRLDLRGTFILPISVLSLTAITIVNNKYLYLYFCWQAMEIQLSHFY